MEPNSKFVYYGAKLRTLGPYIPFNSIYAMSLSVSLYVDYSTPCAQICSRATEVSESPACAVDYRHT